MVRAASRWSGVPAKSERRSGSFAKPGNSSTKAGPMSKAIAMGLNCVPRLVLDGPAPREFESCLDSPRLLQRFPSMQRLLTLSVFLLSILVSSPSFSADFADGLDAYQMGDYAAAFEEWIPLAEQGNASAQYYLGVMYRNGDEVNQDYNTAINWYVLAAEQGHANAQFKLGLIYDMGIGVDRDIGIAIMWYTFAAEQGNANARFRLASMRKPSETDSEN
jgi:hypothetical protein